MRNQGGFTLLEVLLAVSILGVVVSITTVAINGSIKLVEVTRHEKTATRQARVALQRMTEDLSSAIGGAQGVFEAGKSDDQDSPLLIFTSTASAHLNPETTTESRTVIKYAIRAQEDDADRYQLIRFEAPQTAGPSGNGDIGFILCDDMKTVKLSFEDSSGQKVDSWQQPEEPEQEEAKILLPAAVFIRMEFWQDKDREAAISFQTAVWLPAAYFSGKEDA